MTRLYVSLVALVLGTAAFGASILELTGAPVKTITASGVTVPVHRHAELVVDGVTTGLRLTGAGVRRKKLGFVNVDAYVAVSYTSLPGGINPQDPMMSVREADTKAVEMTMARDLTAQQIKSGFEDALRANGVDLDEPNLKSVLDELTFSLPKGTRVVVASFRAQPGIDYESLWIELPRDTLRAAGPELGITFWRSWFGVPADPGLKALKAELVGAGR